jgi:hypothetical protein
VASWSVPQPLGEDLLNFATACLEAGVALHLTHAQIAGALTVVEQLAGEMHGPSPHGLSERARWFTAEIPPMRDAAFGIDFALQLQLIAAREVLEGGHRSPQRAATSSSNSSSSSSVAAGPRLGPSYGIDTDSGVGTRLLRWVERVYNSPQWHTLLAEPSVPAAAESEECATVAAVAPAAAAAAAVQVKLKSALLWQSVTKVLRVARQRNELAKLHRSDDEVSTPDGSAATGAYSWRLCTGVLDAVLDLHEQQSMSSSINSTTAASLAGVHTSASRLMESLCAALPVDDAGGPLTNDHSALSAEALEHCAG